MVEVKENPEFFYVKEIPLYCLLKKKKKKKKKIYIYIYLIKKNVT